MGGDEFAVLQVDPEGVSEARRLGERLIEALHRNADLAMYKAKSDGRNRCQFFDEALNHHARRLALVEQALREPGVTAQLQIVYQPQAAVQSEQVTGVEALLRWKHPDHGAIPPDEFVPIAERSGIIVDRRSGAARELPAGDGVAGGRAAADDHGRQWCSTAPSAARDSSGAAYPNYPRWTSPYRWPTRRRRNPSMPCPAAGR